MQSTLLPSKIRRAFAICCERHYDAFGPWTKDPLDVANRLVALRDQAPTQAL